MPLLVALLGSRFGAFAALHKKFFAVLCENGCPQVRSAGILQLASSSASRDKVEKVLHLAFPGVLETDYVAFEGRIGQLCKRLKVTTKCLLKISELVHFHHHEVHIIRPVTAFWMEVHGVTSVNGKSIDKTANDGLSNIKAGRGWAVMKRVEKEEEEEGSDGC